MKEDKYTIDWDKMTNKFNNQNVSQLTQARIALVYGVTMQTISHCKYRPMSISKINKIYKSLYDIHFKSIMELDDILIKEKNITRIKPIVKLNGGNAVNLCHRCRAIIKPEYHSDLYCCKYCKDKHTNSYGKESIS